MELGICKLCFGEKELVKSHLLPKGLYSDDNPVIISRKVVLKTDAQVKCLLLCKDCEQLFSKNGESWVLPRLSDDIGNFPLLNRLRVAMPFEASPRFEAHSCDAVGIESDKLTYFALSVLWRASARTWVLLGQASSPLNLGEYNDPIREYLLGLKGFPDGVIVNATVCTDPPSRKISYTPSYVENPPYTTFALLTRGLYFRILLGRNVLADLSHLCCMRGSRKPIFLASAEGKVMHAFGELHKTAKVARNMSTT